MEKMWQWLAYRLPRDLIRWCLVRGIANATSGRYSDQVVPDLKAMDMLARWE